MTGTSALDGWFASFNGAEIILFTHEGAKRMFCLAALLKALYVPGRTLQEHYQRPDDIELIAGLFFDGEVIGAGVLLKEKSKTNLSVYVTPEHRRKGYGTKLVQMIRGVAGRPLYVSIIGLTGQAFWDNANSTLGGEHEFTRV
jgi:GNAT superfamily N-acetyltransferase